MSWTTEDLRELMTERSAEPHPAPDRVVRSQSLARRQWWIAAGLGVVAASAAVIGATVGTQLLGRGPTDIERPSPAVTIPAPPHPDGPRLIHSGRVAGLRITTNGPAAVPGFGPKGRFGHRFTVQVTVVNEGTGPWAGQVGAGLVGRSEVPNGKGLRLNYFSEDYCCVLGAAWRPGEPLTAGFAQTLPDGRHVEGVLAEPTLRIDPGEAVTFAVEMRKLTYGIPSVPVIGWVPVLNPRDEDFDLPTPDAWPRVRWAHH